MSPTRTELRAIERKQKREAKQEVRMHREGMRPRKMGFIGLISTLFMAMVAIILPAAMGMELLDGELDFLKFIFTAATGSFGTLIAQGGSPVEE